MDYENKIKTIESNYSGSPSTASEYQSIFSCWVKPFELSTSNWNRKSSFVDYSELLHTAVITNQVDADMGVFCENLDNFYLLHISIKGTFFNLSGGQESEIGLNQALMLFPGMDARLFFPKENDFIVIRIRKEYMDNLMRKLRCPGWCEYPVKAGFKLRETAGQSHLLYQALDHLVSITLLKQRLQFLREITEQLESLIVYQLLLTLDQAPWTKTEKYRNSHYIQTALTASTYMLRHIDEEISLNNLSEHCHVSPRGLQRIFMKVYQKNTL